MAANVLEKNVFWANVFKTHGIRGEMIARVEQDLIENIQNLQPVFLLLEGKPVPFFLEQEFSRWKSEKLVYLKFKNIDTVNQAEIYLNTPIYIPEKLVESVNHKDTVFSLLNFLLYDADNQFIGKINDWLDIQKNPVLSISYKNEDILIPYVEDWILEIDEEKKTIKMNFPPNLLQL